MEKHSGHFKPYHYIIFVAVTFAVMVLCVCVGSVSLPVKDVFSVIWKTISRQEITDGLAKSIIIPVRLPRVICVALEGASLSICGAAMQGLLRNPLADGTTIGVSSGASLGAILAIAFNITIPFLPFAGTVAMAMVFAFLSLILILSLSYKLDYSLSTNTIILIGVIFSMFINSILNLIITFASNKVKTITFWSMGSLAGSDYVNVLTLLVAMIVFGTILLGCSRELNAFAIGEDNARHVGVNVKRVKTVVMISVSALIGVCVATGGTIGFVGLVIPHMTRLVTGPNHGKLLPASMFAGAVFLMLADLLSRTLFNPLELPIGVVTSFVGSITFVSIFYRSRKGA